MFSYFYQLHCSTETIAVSVVCSTPSRNVKLPSLQHLCLHWQKTAPCEWTAFKWRITSFWRATLTLNVLLNELRRFLEEKWKNVVLGAENRASFKRRVVMEPNKRKRCSPRALTVPIWIWICAGTRSRNKVSRKRRSSVMKNSGGLSALTSCPVTVTGSVRFLCFFIYFQNRRFWPIFPVFLFFCRLTETRPPKPRRRFAYLLLLLLMFTSIYFFFLLFHCN